jgi:hypothetical protein
MMKRGRAEQIIQEVITVVSKWPEFAERAQVTDGWRKQIHKSLRLNLLG